MTRRQHVAVLVTEHERWKSKWHYREGPLPYLLGADWMYPYTWAWYRGKPIRHGPSICTKIDAP